MNVLADVPMRLIVSDAPTTVPTSGWVWFAWALWIGLAILVIAAAAVFRRWASRPRDPYERLFARVCEAAGVSAAGRTKLLMRAGGDAREALGQTMLRAMRSGGHQPEPRA
jgi:hypothetical protein